MDLLEFYNINEDPFKLTPDPFYFYPSRNHKEILSSLNYVIKHKEGFFMVTGLPGTGKTTVTKIFIDSWKENAIIALVLTPRLSPEEFLLAILEDLNVKIINNNKNDIIRTFRDFLIDNANLGKRVIIVVDEAQNLPTETLEELRLLSNLETDKEKLLQIVLIGQPELQRRLESDSLKQLNQRIAVRTYLKPLTLDETTEYINYRLIKGGKGFASFEQGAGKVVYEYSAGIPRLINKICSRAMMAAYLNGSATITKKHVIQALRHLSDGVIKPGETVRKSKLAVLFALLCVAALLMFKNLQVETQYFASLPAGGNLPEKTMNEPVQAANLPGRSQIAVSAAEGNQAPKGPEQVQAVKKENERQGGTETVQTLPDKGKQEEYRKRTATVIVSLANVMMDTRPDAEVIIWVGKDESFEITDETRDINGRKWYKIRLSDGKEGWITKDSIKIKVL